MYVPEAHALELNALHKSPDCANINLQNPARLLSGCLVNLHPPLHLPPMTSRATRSRSRGASAADPPAPPRSRSKTPSPAVVAKKVPRSRSRSKSDTKSTPKPAPPKPASANAKPPKSPNLYSQLLNLLLPRRKQFQLYPLAFISALLHFLALANAFLGALSWFNKPLSGEFDFDLIAYGFYAYTFDVTTAFICGRSFFYRWTR